MKLAQTIFSKLKACQELAQGKAEGRRPGLVFISGATLKGRRKAWFTFFGAPSGRGYFEDLFLGYRFAQPRANIRQPFRLLQMALARG